MSVTVWSAAVEGITAREIEIEVDIGNGLPGMIVVGLPGSAVRESCDRVKSALVNSGYKYPLRRVTVNLAPADIRKEGPLYDLPMAMGILAATGQIDADALNDVGIFGELALDGRTRPTDRALVLALAFREAGYRRLIVPEGCAAQAAVAPDLEVIGVRSVADAVAALQLNEGDGPKPTPFVDVQALIDKEDIDGEWGDFSEVRHQEALKRVLMIAAAGRHHVLMTGPPGAGKTMLATRLPGILPPPSPEEAIETTRIWSVAGALRGRGSILGRRPFRSPHHTASHVGLLGGGPRLAPGEVSLAHNGILFLDELPEFNRRSLEALRQPFESGSIQVIRAQGRVTYPARFMLVASMNPCPCGYHTHPERECTCSPRDVHRYGTRVSGPLRDRFDILQVVEPPRFDVTVHESKGMTSKLMREQVQKAWLIQTSRYRSETHTRFPLRFNGDLTGRSLLSHCSMTDEAQSLFDTAVKQFFLSGRAITRVVRVARTIADLCASAKIEAPHILEALTLRGEESGGP